VDDDLPAPVGKLSIDTPEILGVARFDYGWHPSLVRVAEHMDSGNGTWKYVLNCE
jgi:hypothetical protein